MNELEKGMEHALMRAHRYKHVAVARGLHQHAQMCAEQCERFGDPCMAHAKRLQARYWARRMQRTTLEIVAGGIGGNG